MSDSSRTVAAKRGAGASPRRLALTVVADQDVEDRRHASGIVHRDIKPENIFATQLDSQSDFIKVLDFGIAKVTDPACDITLTRDGWLAGTPAYMAPETCTGQAADARSDVYGALMVAHVQETPVAPSVRLGKPVPAQLESIILRCLSKQPTDRYPDAAALDRALADCGVPAWVPAASGEWRRAMASE
jgi:serine/threonine protein kinase